MLWILPLVPVVGGVGVWLAGARWPSGQLRAGQFRARLFWASTVVNLVTLGLAVWALVTRPLASYRFGAGIDLVASIDLVAGVGVVLVAAIATVVIAYATHHEEPQALHRLIGMLLIFVGAMVLLVIAADLLTLLIGWELVGALSWALIGFHWRQADKPAAAAHAFNATRFGDLGLFLAAAAAFAGTGSFAYSQLANLEGTTLAVLVGGIVLSATAKSGQVLFAPWLFSAMGGPTSVSALLHSSTMVAAGSYLLIRLHPVLDRAAWFGPVVIAIGLTTALAGGVVAVLQSHIKKLLAASTSAHYGFMFIAVGAGFPLVALAHLVVHAIFKAHLFMAAGVAMDAVDSPLLGTMRLGRELPVTAVMSLVSALALAAVWPLGGAFTKDQIAAAAAHQQLWIAVAVLLAGGLSAVYATRFQILAFGRMRGQDPLPRVVAEHPGRTEIVAMGVLAVASAVAGVLWLTPVHRWLGELLPSGLPDTKLWELLATLGVAVIAIYLTSNADRRGRLASYAMTGRPRQAADWLGVPSVVKRSIVDPALRLARSLAVFDDRIVDAGVQGVARGARWAADGLAVGDTRVVDAGVRGAAAVGRWGAQFTSTVGERGVEGTIAALAAGISGAGQDSRRMQTGMAHHYYVIISAGLVVLVAIAAFGR